MELRFRLDDRKMALNARLWTASALLKKRTPRDDEFKLMQIAGEILVLSPFEGSCLVPVPGELIERFLRENHGDRERTVHALFNFITAEMISDPGTWTMPPEEIRRRVCACVDQALDDQGWQEKVS